MSAYDELMQKQAAFMQTPGYMEKQAGVKGKTLKEGVETLGKYTGVNPMKALDDLAATLKGAVSGKGAGAARAAAKGVDDIAGTALKGADDVVGAAADDVAAAAAKKVVPTTPTPAVPAAPATPAVPPPVPPPVPPAEAAVAEAAENIAKKPGFWGGLKNRTSELWGKAKNKSSETWNRALNGTREYAMAHPLRAAGIAAAGSAGAGALGGAGLAAMMDEDPNQALMKAYMQQRMNPYAMMMQRPMMNPYGMPRMNPMMNPMMGPMSGINPVLMGGAMAAAGGSPLLGLLSQLQNRAMSYARPGARGFQSGASATQSDLRDKLLSLARFTPFGMSTGWWLR